MGNRTCSRVQRTCECVKALLKAGADSSLKNKAGDTALT